MKKILGLLIFGLFSIQCFAVIGYPTDSQAYEEYEVEKKDKALSDMSAEEFLAMTPKQYKEKTGKKLGFVNALKMKLVQKMLKKTTNKASNKASGGISQVAYVILAILGIGFIGIGMNTGWSGIDWVIGLILMFLFWLPAVIWAFYKMFDYY